jgi:hypothetical protein
LISDDTDPIRLTASDYGGHVQETLWEFPPEDGAAPSSASARPAPAAGPGYRRRGLDRCPLCEQPVEVFPLALGSGFDAVVPGEYPTARVPEDAARHIVRGRLWPGRDPGGWTRIWHRAVCPEEATPEDVELLEMWRALRVRRRARSEAAAKPPAARPASP